MLVDKQSGEIFLYQPIGADFFGDGITGQSMIQALDAIGGKRAIVRINSPGGSVYDGIAIYNALKRYEGGVDVVVDSIAASIASIIALAGEKRTTSKGAMWMIHQAMTFAFGNQTEIGKALAMLEAGDKSLVSIYSEAIKKTPDEIMEMMKAETWFTAEEAVESGLSTDIGGTSEKLPEVAAWFKNAPKALYAKAKSEPPQRARVPVYRHVSPTSY